MRLCSLTIRNFRGFGSAATTVPLDANLVLLFGPNGYGKTSLSEAIEWLLYGYTRRRRRGEDFSKAEYEGCYANAHGGTPIEVEATVRLKDGTEYVIKRSAHSKNDLVSEFFIDGKPAKLSDLTLREDEPANPIVAQHDLQSFIHSRPKDRRDLISNALGLDSATDFKSDLDAARRQFSANPPAGVEEAKRKLQAIAQVLSAIDETKSLAMRWLKPVPEVRAEDDTQILLEAARKFSQTTVVESEAVLQALRERRQSLASTVFDEAALKPPADVPGALRRIKIESTALAERAATLGAGIAKCAAAAVSAYANALLQFWETGLRIASDDHCPMCEEPTLSAGKRAELKRRLNDAQSAMAANQEVVSAIAAMQTAMTRAKQACESTWSRELTTEKQEALAKLLRGKPAALLAFLDARNAATVAQSNCAGALEEQETFLSSLTARIAEPKRVADIERESREIPLRVVEGIQGWCAALEAYGRAWAIFEPDLAAAISSSTAVNRIDAVGKALKSTNEMRSLEAFRKVCDGSLELVRSTEKYLQTKQTELLASRGKDIKTLYDQMNPGASVGFEGMEPGPQQLRLHATSFGVRMSAAANLSECQLNCLGLSFWVARATMPQAPFNFLILDDPVQSMDDDHTEAFILEVIPTLCDGHGRQVIVLSHQKELVDRIRNTNKARDPLVYHFDKFARTGPSITPQINIAIMLNEVKGLADGNEENRRLAVDKLRHVVERLIRDLHQKRVGVPAPKEYDKAEPHELLKLFRKIPHTTQDEYQRLKDTVDFSADAHHQPVGWVVPVTTNIMVHHNKLHTLVKTYGLLPS